MNNLFSEFPILETQNLILRELRISDDKEIYFLRSDDEVNQYLDRKKAETIEDARAFISKIDKGIQEKNCLYWGIELKGSNNSILGTICLWNFSKDRLKAEVGYELIPAFQGKGIMQEALITVLNYAFTDLHLEAVDAVLSPENSRSLRILEKNYFRKSGIPEDEPDMITYTLLKGDHNLSVKARAKL